MVNSDYIFEANNDNFEELVIQKSQDTLVLVDFWAAWCQPCQMLMPILAKMAEKAQGAFILVKVNSDENQELAAQYGVRSLPTVKFFKAGEIVEEFMGVQAESAIQKLIDKNRLRQGETSYQQAIEQLSEGNADSAEQLLQNVLEQEPDFHDASLALAEALIKQDKVDEAEKRLLSLPDGMADKERLEALNKQIKRARLQTEAGDIQTLEAQYEQNPDDMQNMLDLAKARVITGEVEAGLDLYLEAMKKDRSFGDDAARKGLLEAFDLFDKNDPLIREYRAKLYALLY